MQAVVLCGEVRHFKQTRQPKNAVAGWPLPILGAELAQPGNRFLAQSREALAGVPTIHVAGYGVVWAGWSLWLHQKRVFLVQNALQTRLLDLTLTFEQMAHNLQN